MSPSPETNHRSPDFSARLRLALPALPGLPSYDRTWLRGDVAAGVTLGAYLLPAGLPDASLANLHTPCER